MKDAFVDAPRLIIPDSAWEENGYPGDDKSRLLTTVWLNGMLCHVDAIRVVVKNGLMEAEEPMWEDEFDALYLAAHADGHFHTTTIGDWGEYVIFVSPFCR